jgi:hypothetical protein
MAGINRIDPARGGGQRIGVGVIGYGFMGRVHSNAYLKIPYSFASPAASPVLRALCGRNAAKAEDAARRLGYEGWCTDWKDLVRDPELRIVDVCTPDDEHAADRGGGAGKHVIGLAARRCRGKSPWRRRSEGGRQEHALPQLPLPPRRAPGQAAHRPGSDRHRLSLPGGVPPGGGPRPSRAPR